MSAEAVAYVWKHSPYKGVTFTIHLAIADVVNDMHGNEFWAHAKTVAEKARTRRETVSQALNEMIADGFLEALDLGEVDKRKANHQGRRVRFLMPVPENGIPHFDSTDNGSVDSYSSPEPDVRSANIGCALSEHPDVRSANIQGTQKGTQALVKNPSSSFDDSGGSGSLVPVAQNETLTEIANQVLTAWVQATGRDPARCKLNRDRKNAVSARLNDGYSKEDMIAAVRGVALSSWHMGDNPRGKRYDQMAWILDNGSRLEDFRDRYVQNGDAAPESQVQRAMKLLGSTGAFGASQRALGA